jgi:hypothetical protein
MIGTIILICVMALVAVLGRYALQEGRRIEIRNQRKKNKRK